MKEIISKWKKYAKMDEERNFFFIRSLKFKDFERVESLAKNLHKEAFDKIDCLSCGNCCKVSKPLIIEEDIIALAKFLGIPRSKFITDYLEMDEDNDWSFNSLPCPFLNLEDNKCTVYPSRPKDCQEFPHTNKNGFASRSYMHSANTIVCPATYYIVENMKNHI